MVVGSWPCGIGFVSHFLAFGTEDAEDFVYDVCAGCVAHFFLLFGLLYRPLRCDALYHRTGQKSRVEKGRRGEEEEAGGFLVDKSGGGGLDN